VEQTERIFRGSYYRPLAAALARARAADEQAMEPDLPIVDPHHHFIDGPRGRYLVDDLLSDFASGHRIEKTVFIESGAAHRSGVCEPGLESVGETQWVVRLVKGLPPMTIAAGIVARADLDLGDGVERIVLEHERAAAGRLRGIRDLVQHEPGHIGSYSTRRSRPGRMGEEPFRRGVRCIGRLNLTLDLWVFHRQLGEVEALARACPDTFIILNHLGTPLGVENYASDREAVFRVWRDAMKHIARCENIRVKLGGLGMPYTGFDFHYADRAPGSADLAQAWGPFVETACELFGVSRCMFESNFPAEAQTCGYGTLWNAFKRISANWSATEREALFRGTAQQIYCLTRTLT